MKSYVDCCPDTSHVLGALFANGDIMIPKFLKPALLSKRIPPVLTLVLAPITLALSIVVLVSRGDNNSLERNFVVKVWSVSACLSVVILNSCPA